MIRSYSYRVDVCRNNATLTELRSVDNPNVDCNSGGEIKMSMSGRFLDNPLVNWLTDEIQPIQIIDGVEYPVGVFPVGTVSEHVDENGLKTVNVEAYDRCLILQQIKTESILHIPAGTNYMEAVENLLVNAGLSLYLAEPTGEVLATDREDWDIGTSYLTIINALLNEINYAPIWFNPQGFAMLQPRRKPSAELINHQYGADSGLQVLQRACSSETDMFEAANVFVVICDNPDLDGPLIATAVNDNPLSALSVFKRGRRVVQVTRVDNIPNQSALEAYAQELCTNSMLTAETATVYTANMPNHGVYDTVALMHPDIEGLFQEVSWSLILAPGQTMLHQLRRSMLI